MHKPNLFIALDTANWEEFEHWVSILSPYPCGFKVGMEAFYRFGWKAVETVQQKGRAVFLDLKLHDIPNTMARTVKVLARKGIDFLNLHISAGREALEACASAAQETGSSTKLIGVTVLTSLDEQNLKELHIPHPPQEWALHLAFLGYQTGLQGVVCSPWEVPTIKKKTSPSFLTITPGIRLTSTSDDQKRVATPEKAVSLGADYLVIGRPITRSPDPARTLHTLLQKLHEDSSNPPHRG